MHQSCIQGFEFICCFCCRNASLCFASCPNFSPPLSAPPALQTLRFPCSTFLFVPKKKKKQRNKRQKLIKSKQNKYKRAVNSSTAELHTHAFKVQKHVTKVEAVYSLIIHKLYTQTHTFKHRMQRMADNNNTVMLHQCKKNIKK